MDYSVLRILQARILSPGDFPNPGIEPRSTCTAGGFFTSWTPKDSSLITQLVKNPLAMQETAVQFLDQGIPKILEWVAYPFSRKSSQHRNRTGVSCIAGRFFINWLSGKPYLEANQPMRLNMGALDQALPVFHTLVSPAELGAFPRLYLWVGHHRGKLC